jgi:hypothetical protein
VEAAALRVKRITVKGFMDAWTLNVERLRQCCVHVATVGRDPVRIPLCARTTVPGLYERANAGLVKLHDLGAAREPGEIRGHTGRC